MATSLYDDWGPAEVADAPEPPPPLEAPAAPPKEEDAANMELDALFEAAVDADAEADIAPDNTSDKKKLKAKRPPPPFHYETLVAQLPLRVRQGFIVWCEAKIAKHYQPPLGPEGTGLVVSDAQQDFIQETAAAVDAELAAVVEDGARAFARQCGFAALANHAAFVVDAKAGKSKTCELCGKATGNKSRTFRSADPAADGMVLCFAKTECWCLTFVQTLHNLCWFRAYAEEVLKTAVAKRVAEIAAEQPASASWDDHWLLLMGPKHGERVVDPVTKISTSATLDKQRPRTSSKGQETMAIAIGCIAYVLVGGRHMFNKLGLP